MEYEHAEIKKRYKYSNERKKGIRPTLRWIEVKIWSETREKPLRSISRSLGMPRKASVHALHEAEVKSQSEKHWMRHQETI